MRQLHSAIVSGYLANEDWAATMFLPTSNHDSRGTMFCRSLAK